MLRSLVAVVMVARATLAMGPCYKEMEDCKGKTGVEAGTCLKLRQSLNDHCFEWITMHDACHPEFTTGFCATACDDGPCAYTDDAHECLTEWAPPHEMGDHCRQFLPRPGTMNPDEAEDL